MQSLTNLLLLVQRALEVSLTLISPLSLALWLALLAAVGWGYHRGPRLGALLHLMGLIFFFFVIWNHPDYSWYKDNPWGGGYIYALVMLVTYMYLPVKLASTGLRLWRGRRRPGAGAG
jgi:hypothetical protein